jgi:hypothetical protein
MTPMPIGAERSPQQPSCSSSFSVANRRGMSFRFVIDDDDDAMDRLFLYGGKAVYPDGTSLTRAYTTPGRIRINC